MSPERREGLRARVHAGPASARVAGGSLAEVRERSHRAQLDAARAEGRRGAVQELGGLVDAAVERLEAAREEALGEVARASSELGVAIVRALLRHEIPAGNYDIETLVRETLRNGDVGRRACTVHLNPTDAESIADVVFRTGTSIEADPAVERASVHVETEHGVLVRDVEEILSQVDERLNGGRE